MKRASHAHMYSAYFIVKIDQDGRNRLQNTDRRYGIGIFFVPSIQEVHLVAHSD